MKRSCSFRSVKQVFVFLLLGACGAFAQSNRGELRIRVTDRLGLGISCGVELTSAATGYRYSFTTDDDGKLTVKGLEDGIYLFKIAEPGYLPVSRSVEVGSTLLAISTIPLVPAPDPATNPTLVTELAVESADLTANRSPDFGPQPETYSDDSETETVGIPAEVGEKMGAVVAAHISKPVQGAHGRLVLAGGSYDTAGAYAQLQLTAGRNIFDATAAGARTDHFLNPVVPENYTNAGTPADFAAGFARDFTPSDHLAVNVRHRFSRYEIPNERLQHNAGQLQTGDDFETLGTASYQQFLSPQSPSTARACCDTGSTICFPTRNRRQSSPPNTTTFTKDTSGPLSPSIAAVMHGRSELTQTTSFSTKISTMSLPIQCSSIQARRPPFPFPVSGQIWNRAPLCKMWSAWANGP